MVIGLGCRPALQSPTTQVIAGRTMGTTYSVKIPSTPDQPSLPSISHEIDAELKRVNAQMSTYIPTSEISQFNSSGSSEWFPVSSETAQVVELAIEVYQQSAGAFDVTVGPLVNLWGFGPAQRPTQVPKQTEIDAILETVGSDKLQVRLQPPALRKNHPQLQVDLSAIAKGHGVDRVAGVLDRLGIEAYFVEIGGEVRTRGVRQDGRPWRVGIESPDEGAAGLQRVVDLSNQSLATSGNYRNYFELDGQKYAHTIDPRTGWPVRDAIASASVIADNCALADALATCLMSAGYDAAQQLADRHGWAVLLVKADDSQPSGFLSTASSKFSSLYPQAESKE